MLLLGCAALGACTATDDDPGTLDVVLEASALPEGALVLTISGGAVDRVAAPGGELTTFTDGAGTHVLVTGDLSVGPLLSFDIPEGARAREYVVTVDQVADGATFALIDPGTVRVRIAEPE